jgi:hypothetical protein
MIRVVALSLVMLVLPGCLEQRVVDPTPLPIERLVPPGTGNVSGLQDPLRVVVREPAEFESLWKMAWGAEPSRPLPEVDFSTHMVLAVALGGRSTGGYTIQVAEVLPEGDGLEARVVSTAPGKNCAVTLALTQPVDFVSVPVRAGTVRFEESAVVTDCR